MWRFWDSDRHGLDLHSADDSGLTALPLLATILLIQFISHQSSLGWPAFVGSYWILSSCGYFLPSWESISLRVWLKRVWFRLRQGKHQRLQIFILIQTPTVYRFPMILRQWQICSSEIFHFWALCWFLVIYFEHMFALQLTDLHDCSLFTSDGSLYLALSAFIKSSASNGWVKCQWFECQAIWEIIQSLDYSNIWARRRLLRSLKNYCQHLGFY